MSDASLRELERRALSTGAPVDRVAWLRERVRHGGLLLDRLRLAAYAGDRDALDALAPAAPLLAGADDHTVEIGDEASLDELVRWPLAVVLLHVGWSGHSAAARRRFHEVQVPLLRGLAPGSGIGLFVLLLDAFEPARGGALDQWLGGRFGYGGPGGGHGNGELVWSRAGRIVEAWHHADVWAPDQFVRATVRAFDLGL